MKTVLLSTLLFLLASSCSRNHVPSVFEQKLARHRSVAILPAEMIYTGVIPKNVKEEDLVKMEETESRIFQQYLHDNILQNGEYREVCPDCPCAELYKHPSVAFSKQYFSS
jgi:hypothetical protein